MSRRLKQWKWRVIIGGAVFVLLIGGSTLFFLGNNTTTTPPDTVAVERGTISVTISGSGSVAVDKSLDLAFQASGKVESILIDEGTEVAEDDVLARLETRELELAVADAEASRASTLAKLEQTQKGNATEQDITSAQASVEQARLQLEQQQHGNATSSDLATAQASLRSAQAQLNQQAVTNRANIANAESRLRVAEAQLADLEAGADSEDVSSVQRAYNQAVASYNNAVSSLNETRDKLSREKTQAKITMDKATNALQIAQSEYSIAYWRHHGVKKEDIIPSITELPAGVDPNSLTNYGEMTEEEAFVQAELQLRNAEADVETAKINYEQALLSEKTGVFQAEQSLTSAEAQRQDAEIQLQAIQDGADEVDLVQAREEVAQARIALEQLTGGGAAADLTQRQAAVEQSAAQLAQLQEGGSEYDIASSQANYQQAIAQLEKLTAPSTNTDLSIQQASVQQAENSLERARIDLAHAELTAPFAGIITSIDIVPGSVVGESSIACTVIDRDPLHVDVTLNENDITLVTVGQDVLLNISALPDWHANGTVTYISPIAEQDTEVVLYRVRVSFPDSDSRVKVGMTADLDIVTDSKSDVLLVPNTALITKGEQQAVMVIDSTTNTPNAQSQSMQFRTLTVETGITDGTHTEIHAGIEEGQHIIANPSLLDSTTTSSSRNRSFLPFGQPPDGGGRTNSSNGSSGGNR